MPTEKGLNDLPYSVVMKLTQLLDRPQPEWHSWRALLPEAERTAGAHYSPMEVGILQNIANKGNSSPSEALLHDFITRGVTVDQLYLMLQGIGHRLGMTTLQEHVSPGLREGHGNDRGSAGADYDSKGNPPHESTSSQAPPTSNPSYPCHVESGPLPPTVPINQVRATIFTSADMPHGGPAYPCTYTRPDSLTSSSFSMLPGGFHGAHSQASSSLSNGSSPYISPVGYYPSQPSHQPYPGGGMGEVFSSSSPPPYSSQLYLSSYDRALVPPLTGSTLYSPQEHSASPTAGHAQYLYGPQAPGNHLSPVADHTRFAHVQPNLPPSMEDGTAPLRGFQNALPDYPAPQQHLRMPDTSSQESSSSSNPSSSASSSSASSSSSSGSDLMLSILMFSYSELSVATKNFTKGFIGLGSFGSVFRANVRGCGPYAIKKLHNESEMEGAMFYEPLHQESFMQELQSLVKYKHRNILSLVAISNDGPRPCLVYEYMEHGSLADCLLGKHNVNLTWHLRMDIANQIADALHFLHTVNHPNSLIHGDVKSSNILLDKHLTPKLSDFGLAREFQNRPGQQVTSYSTSSAVVMGTVAYMAPEYLRSHKASTKTDVYAFGVVMLELFTGLSADDPSLPERTLVLRLHRLLFESDNTDSKEVVLHADRRALWPSETACGFFDIAAICLRPKAKGRPPMDQVRDQILRLKDDAVQLSPQMQQLYVSEEGPQRISWN